MHKRKIIVIILLLLFSVSAAGCGSKMVRSQLKRGNQAFKRGDMKGAIKSAKLVLQTSPRNIFGKRLMNKIKAKILEDIEADVAKKSYKTAIRNAEMLLKDVDSQNRQAKALLGEAKKHMLASQARRAIDKNNPIQGHRLATQALKIDSEFEQAKKLQTEANQHVEEKIASLMSSAQQMIEKKQFEKLRALAQDILIIAPQNREVVGLLKEAQAQILARNMKKNLNMAKRFYAEGIYESALKNAEAVLKADSQNAEAKEIVEKSKAEINKPKLRLTGFTKIKGMEIAHIEIIETRERFLVKEGEIFGGFKISAIDFDLRAVVVTFVKTGSQQSLTMESQ